MCLDSSQNAHHSPVPSMRITTLVTCLIATLSAPLAGQSQLAQQSSADIPRLVQMARGTVVLIKAFDRQGKVLGLGSGFRIARGPVLPQGARGGGWGQGRDF